MNDISYINQIAASDTAIMARLGAVIKHHRLMQNRTQDQLASDAGIARSTLSLCERGGNMSLLVFIQLLRALKLLHMLGEFQVKNQLSPLQLAKMEQSKRVRAKQTRTGKDNNKPETDW